jgi:hypothetical protein
MPPWPIKPHSPSGLPEIAPRLSHGRLLRDPGDVLGCAVVKALKETATVVRGARTGLTLGEREAIVEQAVAAVRNLPNHLRKLNGVVGASARRLAR